MKKVKKTKTTKSNGASDTPKPRTVKISDALHHEIDVLSTEKRMRLQVFIEGLLRFALDKKAYDKFPAVAA
jgi:hypothetical protein